MSLFKDIYFLHLSLGNVCLPVIDTAVVGCVEISTTVRNCVSTTFSACFAAESFDPRSRRPTIVWSSLHYVLMNRRRSSVVEVAVVCRSCRITFYKTPCLHKKTKTHCSQLIYDKRQQKKRTFFRVITMLIICEIMVENDKFFYFCSDEYAPDLQTLWWRWN